MRLYVAQHRNGYGAVDEQVDGRIERTIFAGLKPTRLAGDIADALNGAYSHAWKDATGKWPSEQEPTQ